VRRTYSAKGGTIECAPHLIIPPFANSDSAVSIFCHGRDRGLMHLFDGFQDKAGGGGVSLAFSLESLPLQGEGLT
jgi:hypothetical protein